MIRALIFALWTAVAAAQSPEQLNFSSLAAKARESTELTLDASTLALAGKQMTGDEAKVKGLLAGLKGIVIRSYEFEREGAYTHAEVEQIRRVFQTPGWKRVVAISSKADSENYEVFSKLESGKTTAMALLTTEPKEVTLVYMDGAVDLGQLSELGARFGASGSIKKGTK